MSRSRPSSMTRLMRSRTASFNRSGEDSHEPNTIRVFLNQFTATTENDMVQFEFLKRNTVEELIGMIMMKCDIPGTGEDYEICEIMATLDGQTCKERRLDGNEYPVAVQLLWPKPIPTVIGGNEPSSNLTEYRFVFRLKRSSDPSSSGTTGRSAIDAFLTKFLQQPKDKEYPDLCMLPELTEITLLDNLRDRFNSGHIYTYIGPILIAVNPFKFYPIYNPKYAQLYQNRRLGSLPPHIFAIADASYHKMLRTRQNQCIVISGESGSGKTESTNFFLHHLMALSKRGGGVSDIEQTLLCAGPVLEAFGNAVTAQNNNSSRFGKFIQVNYRENGMVSGANVQIYLLEKSRIISQALEERNYHVFYYLLDGASEEEREYLMLMKAQDYHYLNQNDFYGSEEVDEAYEFRRLRHSMELVGFSRDSQMKIFTVLSAVLMLGNVQYVQRSSYHSDDAAYIQNEEVLGIISSLLQVSDESLKQALTIRKTVLRTETLVTRYKVAEAINTRDAMAKCLYNALFHWIVLRINQALLKQDTSTLQKGRNIGILDIFGFEDVGAEWNSFEQFCINYANERLQTYFNQHIFQFEQEEYLNQGIAWTNIEFTDNSECLTLVHGKPTGIFSLIDEECSIAKGTDETLLGKLNQFHKIHEYYEAPQKKESAFIIAHYAGKVKYQIRGFREKNKDLMRQDVVTALKNSKTSFVRELVAYDPVAVFRWAVLRATLRAASAFKSSVSGVRRSESSENRLGAPKEEKIARRSSESQLNALLRGDINPEVPSFCDNSVIPQIVQYVKKKAPKKKRSGGLYGLRALKALATTRKQNQQQSSRKMLSVGAQFQTSLSRLMETLGTANPFFIRCIRSNNDKNPCIFDEDIILRQLRYTGMLETVRIRRAGYSVRLEYEEFVAQYRMLLRNGRFSGKNDIREFIREHPFIDYKNVQFGHSKVFMRDAEKLLIDDQLHRGIMAYILKLQSWFRARLTRKRYLATRSGVVKIQALVRGWLVRNQQQKRAMAALCIQTYWRGYYQRKKYAELKDAMTQFQALCRGFIIRHKVDEQRTEPNNNTCFARTEPLQFVELPDTGDEAESDKIKIGSPGQQSDEGILTKESSQDDNLQGNRKDAKFTFDSEESSGILEDEDEKGMSVDVTFTLDQGTKLKLVSKTAGDDQSISNRRGSLVPTSSSAKLPIIRRTASSDTLSNKGSSAGPLKDLLKVAEGPGSTPPPSPRPRSGSSSAARKRSGFIRAKRSLKHWLSRRSDQSEESDLEDMPPQVTPTGVRRYPPKPKALSLMPDGDSGTFSSGSDLHSHALKASWMHKTEPCILCRKNVPGIFMQGYKCQTCKLCFHKECAQFACKYPCSPCTSPSTPRSPAEFNYRSPLRPWANQSHKHHSSVQALAGSTGAAGSTQSVGFLKSWNLTRTQQQTDPSDKILGGLDDLRQFSVFIFKKQTELAIKSQQKRDTIMDAIFKKSLREFHTELISYEAILKEDHVGIKYRDLISCFEGSLSKVCVKEQITFPVPLGLNAFRGFLNEFVQQQSVKKKETFRSKVKSFRKRKARTDVTVSHKGHRFKADIVHVPTYCEFCNQFMWHAEKIFICLGCRISCHKRCHSKLTHRCAQSGGDSLSGGRFFGADLTALVDEEHPVPIMIEKMMLTLEVRGMFLEGIYRKSAPAAQAKQIRAAIETAKDPELISFDDVNIHCIASLLKAFFRELPDPLFPSELYENFLNISEIPDPKDRTRCLYSMVDFLPKCNKALLDRLMYHLARVAHQEEVNKMNASNLAVIFAPCLLRRSLTVHAQEQLQDVSKQALCVEALIDEKLCHYRLAVSEIVELEQATEKVTENLRKIEDHVRRTSGDYSQVGGESISREMEQARQLFVEQLEFLDKEKDKLIDELPPLAPMASSEDDALTSSDEVETTPLESRKKMLITKQYSVCTEEYAIDLGTPPTFSTLVYRTKRRAPPPKGQRKPSIRFLKAWKDAITSSS